MHILNRFVTAQCFLLLLFYPDAERVIWMRSGNSELAYFQTRKHCFTTMFPKGVSQQMQASQKTLFPSHILQIWWAGNIVIVMKTN